MCSNMLVATACVPSATNLFLTHLRGARVGTDDEQKIVSRFDVGEDLFPPLCAGQDVLPVNPAFPVMLHQVFMQLAYEVLVLPGVRNEDVGDGASTERNFSLKF
jgi:hypothetical protein